MKNGNGNGARNARASPGAASPAARPAPRPGDAVPPLEPRHYRALYRELACVHVHDDEAAEAVRIIRRWMEADRG